MHDLHKFWTEVIDYAHSLSEKECPEYKWILGQQKVRYGHCDYKKKELCLSIPLLTLNPNQIVDTIRHEVAHVTAYKKYRDSKHGWDWKREAIRLGAKPVACQPAKNMAPHKYELVCDSCKKVIQKRYKRMNISQIKRRWSNCCKSSFHQRKAPPVKYDIQVPEFSTLLEKA